MKITHGTLILAADGSKLLLFRNRGDEKFPVLETVAHEEQENPSTGEQGTDTPGRTWSRAGSGRSGMEETDWHDQAEGEFARHAAQVLERAAAAEPGAGIVVLAAPRTLGVLRGHYGRETSQRLLGEIAKDFVRHETGDIAKAIAAHQAG